MADESLQKERNATIDYDTSKVEKTKIVAINSIVAVSFTIILKDGRISHISGDILRGGVASGRVTVDMNSEYYNLSFERFKRFDNEERKLIQNAISDNVEAFLNDIVSE